MGAGGRGLNYYLKRKKIEIEIEIEIEIIFSKIITFTTNPTTTTTRNLKPIFLFRPLVPLSAAPAHALAEQEQHHQLELLH